MPELAILAIIVIKDGALFGQLLGAFRPRTPYPSENQGLYRPLPVPITTTHYPLPAPPPITPHPPHHPLPRRPVPLPAYTPSTTYSAVGLTGLAKPVVKGPGS